MKLIHDCVRDVMLYIEEHQQYDTFLDANSIDVKYSKEDILYTCDKLNEAGFIEISKNVLGGCNIEKITYNGHKFLDSIRDNKIWSATKSKISQLASVSLPMLQEVATSLIKSKLGI